MQKHGIEPKKFHSYEGIGPQCFLVDIVVILTFCSIRNDFDLL